MIYADQVPYQIDLGAAARPQPFTAVKHLHTSAVTAALSSF